MDSFLVLGLVPGTNIQITFLTWLLAGAAVIGSLVLLYAKRRHLLMFWLLALRLRRQIARLDTQLLTLKLG